MLFKTKKVKVEISREVDINNVEILLFNSINVNIVVY